MAAQETMNLEVRAKFKKLQLKAVSMGLTAQHLSNLESIKLLEAPKRYQQYLDKATNRLAPLKPYLLPALLWSLVAMGVVMAMFAVQWPISRERWVDVYYSVRGGDKENEPCIAEIPDSVGEFFRPPVDCKMCRGLTQIDRVSGITPEEFEEKYAYTGRPLLVEDATKNWTALGKFNFDFFKSIYGDDSPVMLGDANNCQFFPYRSNFESLSEVFNMTSAQAQYKTGTKPWYIGWSNCDSSAANTLRSHYTKPYFLPRISESAKTDWIFMGCPGYGAHMHIDNVNLPSWQALVTGSKRWVLEPPPECYHECIPRMEVEMKQGDMIVVDTNIWYHSTLILGDEISIAIGSEFD